MADNVQPLTDAVKLIVEDLNEDIRKADAEMKAALLECDMMAAANALGRRDKAQRKLTRLMPGV